jgi:adenylate cyclase
MLQLTSSAGGQTIDFAPGQTLVLGRAVTSDVPVADPTISRRHAELTAQDGSLRVRDLDSSNGTFVNGARVNDATAVPGDTITFGKVSFQVREPKAREPSDAGFSGGKAPGATILRQLPVSVSGPIPVMESAGEEPTALEPGDSAAEQRAKKLALQLEILMELLRQEDVDRLLGRVLDFTFQTMKVDRASLLTLDEQTGELIPRVSRTRSGDTSTSRHVPQSIARKAVEERVAILSDNAVQDERFKGKSILMQSVRSALCTPLLGRERPVLGILYVDNLTTTHSFSDKDLEFLIAFGHVASAAIENSELSERIRREALVLSNFQRYFAPNVAKQILKQTGAIQLGGQKRPVCIFFSDIRGFTAMSETMNPDQIATILTEYFTEMVEIIFEHGGTLDKFMGDAIMALWGAPIGQADDADRAMQAARAQLTALATMNERWRDAGRPELAVGMGINFGEVFAGNIGSDRRLEYTVIGDAVNTAERLCSAAGPNEILVSDAFLQALKEPPPVEELPPLDLKGKARAVAVYRVKE